VSFFTAIINTCLFIPKLIIINEDDDVFVGKLFVRSMD